MITFTVFFIFKDYIILKFKRNIFVHYFKFNKKVRKKYKIMNNYKEKSKSLPRPHTAKNNSKSHQSNEPNINNILENENLESLAKTLYSKNLKYTYKF